LITIHFNPQLIDSLERFWGGSIMKWKNKTVAVAALAVIFLLILYVLINTFFITKDYLYGPPLLFISNRYLEVDIYPHGYEVAAVFTNNCIEGTTTPEDIDILRLFLKKMEVRGVFFVIPNYKQTYPLSGNPKVVEEINKLRADGHEIAQTGTYHTYGPDLARGAEPGQELLTLAFDDQLERICRGKEILEELGFPPIGFRAPSFATNRETFRVLETLDYIYDSSSSLPPRTLKTLFRPSLSQGILYPYHPSGYDFLAFTDYIDPTQNYSKAKDLFQRVKRARGVFVFHTYIGSIAQPERLQLLSAFMEYMTAEKSWCCPMGELSRWWQAREKLRVETRKRKRVFEIVMENRSSTPLQELGIELRKHPEGVSEYLVLDGRGKTLHQGKLPVETKIYVTIPGHPEARP
jgi:peptidoglycan/xylan/chitin deacetylase (PgdA/CDA1 family)